MNKPATTLRQHRKWQGLTVSDIAELAKVSIQTIEAIEKGKPDRIQNFQKLANALKVELMDIREYRDLVKKSDTGPIASH